MAAQWFTVRKSDRRIKGWQRSGKAVTPPADTADLEYIVATDADLAQYGDLQRQAIDDGRSSQVNHVGGVLQLPADTRPLFRVEVDRTEVDISLAETVALTITRINPDGTTITGFNASVRYEILDKILKFVFVNGVVSRTFAPKDSGEVLFQSTPKFKLEGPVTVTFVE